jgi:hypothetical protein
MPPPTLEKEVGAAADPPGRRCACGAGQPARHINDDGHRRRSPSPSLAQHQAIQQLRRPFDLVRVKWVWLLHNLGRAH